MSRLRERDATAEEASELVVADLLGRRATRKSVFL